MTTLLIEDDRFARSRLRVEGDAYRHLFRAQRLASGSELRVVDGRGRARWARVGRVDRRGAELELGDAAPAREPAIAVEVLVAPPRSGRASWMVEKLTELGVAAVRFVGAERAPRDYGAATLARLQRVAAAAVEQCGRSRLPEISGVHPWPQAVELAGELEERWLLEPGAPPPPPPAGPLAVLIGPEGGWTEAERRALAALPGRPVGLGPTTLRIETAATAACALALAVR